MEQVNQEKINLGDIKFSMASKEDLPALEEIRERAFEPIFESFRKQLGNEIYEIAQMPEDMEQKELIVSYLKKESEWELWKVTWQSKTIGFVAIRLDKQSKVGEIGLNAVDPNFSGQGIGTEIYHFAIREMKKAGMKVATVATGGDLAHLPARIAYEKAGFTVQIPSVWMCQKLE